MLKGCDYSFGSGVTAAQIKAYGPFVMRYLSGGNSKDISAVEAKNFKAAGVALGFVWETTGAPTSAGLGTTHATEAQAQLNQLAAAVGDDGIEKATVYFAIDEESNPYSVAYIKAAAAVLGKARTGVYGGYGTVNEVMNAGVCEYAWQTYAWSGGKWDNRAVLRQVQNDIKVGPCDADADQAAYFDVATPVFAEADLAKIGFVFVPATPAPKPTPAPTPAPKPAPAPAPKLTPYTVPKSMAIGTVQVVLSWAAVNATATYHVQVTQGKTVVLDQETTETSLSVNGLKAGTLYQWRLFVKADTKHTASPWSAKEEFTV